MSKNNTSSLVNNAFIHTLIFEKYWGSTSFSHLIYFIILIFLPSKNLNKKLYYFYWYN